MGIKGINKFITKINPHIKDRIDMRSEIENWKRLAHFIYFYKKDPSENNGLSS